MSETEPMTLTDFLLARIAEDEADADSVGKWQARERIKAHPHAVFVVPRLIDCERLRAECEAKRRIVELHKPQPPTDDVCSTCYVDGGGWDDIAPMDLPCPTLRALALPYASHPDYDPTWRP